MRTFTNKPGEYFDPTKTDVIYAEDMNELAGQVDQKQQYPAWSAKFQGDISGIDKRKYLRTILTTLGTAPKKMIVLNGVVFGITNDAPGRFFRFDPNGVLGVSQGSAAGLTNAFTDIATDGTFIFLSAIDASVGIVQIDPVSLLAINTYMPSFGETGIACMVLDDSYLYGFTPDNPVQFIKLLSFNLSTVGASTPTSFLDPRFCVRDDKYIYVFYNNSLTPKLSKYDIASLSEILTYSPSSLPAEPKALCYNANFLYIISDSGSNEVEKIAPHDMTFVVASPSLTEFGLITGLAFDGYNIVVVGAGGDASAALLDPRSLKLLGTFYDTVIYSDPLCVCSDGLRHFIGIIDTDVYVISKILREGQEREI